MSEETLYGREPDRQAIFHSDGAVLLVAGDSGIGKSEFLASLTNGWETPVLVASPIVLAGVRGSLQTAVATAIGDCLHQYTAAHPHSARDVWAALKDVVGRAGSVTGRQVGEIVMGRAFEYVESKLGKEAAKVIRAVLIRQPHLV